MTDLYSILGLTRDADHTAVRKAYRLLSKKAHPDVGGDAEQFAEIQRAHDILTDEDRRARYDRTGDISEARPEGSEEAEVYNFTTALMNNALQFMNDEATQSLIETMTSLLQQQRSDAKSKKRGIEETVKRLQTVHGRITAKKDNENKLAALMAGQITGFQVQIQQLDHNLSIMDRVEKLIAQHEYRTDKKRSYSNDAIFTVGTV